MYSDKQNILLLTALMRKAAITEIVVCPGSRNAPVVHNFKEAGFSCYEITDERSAGFFALGLIEARGHAVAVCCTSGSAVLNLAPAVAEAYYHPLPLLVITADRPPCWIGQQDGQTMPQPPAFGTLVRKSVSLPEFQEGQTEARWYCNRLVNEAFMALRKYNGPVHVNIPISEPLFGFDTCELPLSERLIEYSVPDCKLPDEAARQMTSECAAVSRMMVVVGQLPPIEAVRVAPGIAALVRKGVVVIAERLANLSLDEALPYNFDLILQAYEKKEELAPEMVVTIGGHIVSKRIKQLLRAMPPRVHWHVSPCGELADLFCCSTRLVESSPETVVSFLAEHSAIPSDKPYWRHWMRLSCFIGEKTKHVTDYGFSEMSIVSAVTSGLDSRWDIQVANSSAVRHLQSLADDHRVVMCNRGINGIEGSLSTAVGYATGGRPTLLIIGDLSFFYDRNGLWNNFVRRDMYNGKQDMSVSDAPLRILLINNSGGGIFHSLPGLSSSPYLSQYIAAEHHTSARSMAEESGCAYLSASDGAGLERCKARFLNPEGKVVILEVFVDMAENDSALLRFYKDLEGVNNL
ncbi:MAG: 2-succinyl-5-enolpyruvyl-6-hydroxy-3-cyclohexene-1-carboxylic-acid synthase [Bacteroides sp.]|nr:2-succinyl-5-enolpyruvyl-6-hydroxy-3-cyclohexene-1-carboxylic-acid synthase [Roseburia sp.]MCM1347481.1 2-succinyl-5-enolpyruvyl-6-hydroxy-3-cyclohexene-1-carboxylic-acid synthase [Bacteroides sp.]MCM1421953.1 2-succinyl-5-enolpyruvyl-6-hydroxy-3-cyclohexene-1-carboxylic-acid synthase [Bacteroides sp.]